MNTKIRKYISYLALVCLAGFVSAAENYVDYIGVPVNSIQNYVNGTGILYADVQYLFWVNITGGNITSVTFGDVAATNMTGAYGLDGVYGVSDYPNEFADFMNNCTYTDLVLTVVAINDTGNFNTNITYQSNITVAPCIESSTAASNSMIVTDRNTTTLDLTDYVASSTVLWMDGLAYNSTNRSCYYQCSNVDVCQSAEYITAGTDINGDKCVLTVTRSASDVGEVFVDVDPSIAPSLPSNMPGAVVAGVASIIVAYAVVRIKRRGGVKEA